MVLPRNRLGWIAVLVCLTMTAGIAARFWWSASKPNSQTVYRIGYGTFPPYFVMPNAAPPTGFAVEVVREATRRLGMRVEWIRLSGTTEKALTTGQIDLYPMLAMIPSRVGIIDFSEPWWENTLVVVSQPKAPSRAVADSEGKRISLIHATFGLQRMKTLFPRAIPVPEKEYEMVVQNVCTGRAQGAIIEMRLATGLTLLPQCAKVELTMAWFPELNLTYGVGARLGLKKEADRIQAEIVRMAQDGTMTKLGEPWGVQVTNQKKLLDSLVAGRVREQWWLDVTLGTVLLLLLAVAQSYRLRRERRKAEEALAIRSEFVANISHEIRTPLNGLLGMTQILRDTPLDTSQRECAEILDSSGQTLLALINELLDFSKLEAGKLQVESIALSPRKIAREVVQLFAARASAHAVLIAFEESPGVPEAVLGDPIRLRQILSNLVSNAVKFTARGSIRVRVSPVSGSGDSSSVRFEVIDTGCGVDASFADRIFEPFTQADGSTSRKYGGTGLGLSICKNLATLLGGRIGVQSNPGEGSTFWVEIPFLPAAANALGESARPPENREPLGLHILVAEDNAVNQHVLVAHLKKLGCTWTMTANGREAVEAAHREHFDAVLMDGQMPEVDGFTAARRIRALPSPYGEVPIIGVTACAFEEDRQRCLESGMQSVLTKPFTAAGLREALGRLKNTAITQS
ncbi:MAG: ATP-binding protein [Bryobacteraceae bacterium]